MQLASERNTHDHPSISNAIQIKLIYLEEQI